MMELIVLGMVPGTHIQLTIDAILFFIAAICIVAACALYVFTSRRELFELGQKVRTIELITL